MQARETAGARLRTQQARWATDIGLLADRPTVPALVVALHPPAERDALADQLGAEKWAREWGALDGHNGVEVEWITRSWPRVGRQRVPVRVRLADPDAVALFAGAESFRAWCTLRDRAATVVTRLGDSTALRAVIRRHAAELVGFDDDRFVTVLDVSAWLVEHSVRGLRPRQLPIRGVDTKWFAAHRSILTDLYGALAASHDLGIVDADPLVRVRVLDSAIAGDGPADFAAPASVLATLHYRPDAVLVFENLESVLALPPWPGAIVVHGSGYAVDMVGRLPWISAVPVLYWGDLDSDGFAILHRLRLTHPQVTSVLMDSSTLLAHRDLWVSERKPNRGEFSTLTDSETAALTHVREHGNVRLEQERIPWEIALTQLRVAWSALVGRV